MAPMMVPLQQSPEFARTLRVFGTPLSCDAPVILERRIPALGAVTFASRISPDTLHIKPRIVNAEADAPATLRAKGYARIITPAHIALWDLDAPDLRAGLHGKWRNRLVKGEQNGLRMRDSLWDGTPHPLFEHATKLAKARRYQAYPTALLSAYAVANPKDTLLVEAFDRGTLVAACLVLCHGTTATYQSAWSTPTGHALQAPRLVLWHAAQRLKSRGYRYFDLGVVETDHAEGLARFKLGTGAELRRLGGTWLRLR